MKKKPSILTFLFCLTALMAYAPMLQQNWKPFKFKDLIGYHVPTEKPEYNYFSYVKGNFQRQSEQYLQENFGFREPLIRMYNQCIYDLFKTTSNNDVAIEKDGWLYHTETVCEYYGNMEQKFGLNSNQVSDLLDEEARCLAKVNTILKEYGVHLLVFTLPSKSFVYPEHLRRHPVGDTAFNAIDYYEQELEARSVPYINMTSWFKQMQDTASFDLFYSKGSHWASGATLAVDTLLRYMEQLSGNPLARIQLGEPYPIIDIPWDEKDLENLLNLVHPLKHEPVYEYPVTIATDDSTTYPKVWFIGTSFYWYMKRRVSFDTIFQSRDFTFYRALHYTNRENETIAYENVDFLHELLLHDYVVFFRDGPQLHSYGFLFPGKALISLCISEERFNEKLDYLADSMGNRDLALIHLQCHPELFEELHGENIPSCRNPKIELVLTERMIRNDRNWFFLLNAKAINDSVCDQVLFESEARRVLNHQPLLRDNAFFTSFDYFELLLKETGTLSDLEIRVRQHEFDDDSLMMAACAMDALARQIGREPSLSIVRSQASEKKISVDKMFRDDVVWCFKELDDLERYSEGNHIQEAFEQYKVEHELRLNNEMMIAVNNKRINENLPLRVVINNQVDWVILTRTQKK